MFCSQEVTQGLFQHPASDAAIGHRPHRGNEAVCGAAAGGAGRCRAARLHPKEGIPFVWDGARAGLRPPREAAPHRSRPVCGCAAGAVPVAAGGGGRAAGRRPTEGELRRAGLRCLSLAGVPGEPAGRVAAALAIRATPSKHANVLFHLLGQLKKQINAEDKAELIERIEAYLKGLVPLVVPMTLLNHHDVTGVFCTR